MKNYNRILALLMAVLLLFGAMTAFAEVEVAFDVPQDIDGLDLDMDVPDLDISPEALELSDNLSLVEEAPEATYTVSNADGETPTDFYDSFTMTVGEKKKLYPHPQTLYSLIVTSNSSDPNVARITPGGLLIAVTAGRCIITVNIVNIRSSDPPKVRRYDVTVVGGPVLSETEKTLHINETFQLNVSDLGKFSIKSWSSSDPGVATVDDGKVTAVGEGQCDISVELSNGGVLKCRVKVVSDAGLSSNAVKLTVHKQSTLMVRDRSLRKVSWSCSDPSIVKIMTKGATCLIIAQKAGECTITAKLEGGKKLTCKVIVQ